MPIKVTCPRCTATLSWKEGTGACACGFALTPNALPPRYIISATPAETTMSILADEERRKIEDAATAIVASYLLSERVNLDAILAIATDRLPALIEQRKGQA